MRSLPVQQGHQVTVGALHCLARQADRLRLRAEALLALKFLSLLVEVHDILIGVYVAYHIAWSGLLLEDINEVLEIHGLLRVLLVFLPALAGEGALLLEVLLPALLAHDVLTAGKLDRLPVLQVEVLFALVTDQGRIHLCWCVCGLIFYILCR